MFRSPPAQYGMTRQSSARSLWRISRIGRMFGWLGCRDVEWEELGGPLRMDRRYTLIATSWLSLALFVLLSCKRVVLLQP